MESWRKILTKNFRSWQELFLFLEIEGEHNAIEDKRFPLNLPRRLAEKIEKGNLKDPILKQFLPTREELEDSWKNPFLKEGDSSSVKGGRSAAPEEKLVSSANPPLKGRDCASSKPFSKDPLDEAEYMRSPKLMQKYKGRLLLLPTSACAMHCRFCFRRHFPYEKEVPGWEKEIELLKQDTSIEEVILSGGDPLSLSNEQLQDIFDSLPAHVKRFRIHTRFPIGIPERIDDGFLSVVKSLTRPLYIMIHCNHPHELDSDIGAALIELRKAGAILMNHSVLLKGVNDNVDTLEALSQGLLRWGVIPYYLSQLDRVQGASHFDVEESQGKQLVNALLERLPGMGIPRYAREVPGAKSKTPLLEPLHPVDSL